MALGPSALRAPPPPAPEPVRRPPARPPAPGPGAEASAPGARSQVSRWAKARLGSVPVRALAVSGLRPVVDRVFPREEAAEAFARFEKGPRFGKVVISH
nr:hypothetical protein [Streptomyces sp. MH191]